MRKFIMTVSIIVVVAAIPCAGITMKTSERPFAINPADVDSIVISGFELDSVYDHITQEQNNRIIEHGNFFRICTVSDRDEFFPLIEMIDSAKTKKTSGMFGSGDKFVPAISPYDGNLNETRMVFSISIYLTSGRCIELYSVYLFEFVCGGEIYVTDYAFVNTLKWYALQAYIEQNPQQRICNWKPYIFGSSTR